jgi:hypothetical protein
LAGARRLAETLAGELATFAQAVADALPGSADSAPADGAAVDWPRLRTATEQLATLLAVDDMRAMEVLAGSVSALRAALGREVDYLSRAVDAFDFPAALTILQGLRAAHPELAERR